MNDVIYNDYSIDDVLLGECCSLGKFNVYPIRVKDWNVFQKYTHYLLLSKKHYKLSENDSLLEQIVISTVERYKDIVPKEMNEQHITMLVINDLCNMFSMITHRKDIQCRYDNGFCFITNEDGVLIDDSNFDIFRKIVLKQNILFEPIIYESEFKRKWAEKVKKGKEKNNKGLGLREIINIVRCELKISYEDISNENILQLFTDFSRISNTKNFDALNLLKTTYGVDLSKIPNVDYQEPIMDKLLRNPELSYFKDFDGEEYCSVLT